MLTCGGLDLEWPSCRNPDDITFRLAATQAANADVHAKLLTLLAAQ